ncbi:hypothetical protein BX666DRAFT_1969784 [Dichotomocladium elegans]|nr:hypothetical protein BX666DRAFT_1969784 [Dichotomocladium elegans]
MGVENGSFMYVCMCVCTYVRVYADIVVFRVAKEQVVALRDAPFLWTGSPPRSVPSG